MGGAGLFSPALTCFCPTRLHRTLKNSDWHSLWEGHDFTGCEKTPSSAGFWEGHDSGRARLQSCRYSLKMCPRFSARGVLFAPMSFPAVSSVVPQLLQNHPRLFSRCGQTAAQQNVTMQHTHSWQKSQGAGHSTFTVPILRSLENTDRSDGRPPANPHEVQSAWDASSS